MPQTINTTNADLHGGGFIGGFYIRPMGPYEQGDSAKGHSHTIDHCMNLVRGSVSIQWETPDGETGTVDALVPCKILIKAECSHLITALEADTYWECWFSEAECEKEHGTTDLPWHV